jgi:hypothetical protein
MRVAIADALMSFADMEAAIETVIWDYTGIDHRYGRLLTGMDIRRKVEIVRALLAEKIDAQIFSSSTSSVWPQIANITLDRNMLVHGTLYMLDRSVLMSISFRGKTLDGMFTGSIFPLERLAMIKVTCDQLAQTFAELAAVYSQSRSIPAQQLPEES